MERLALAVPIAPLAGAVTVWRPLIESAWCALGRRVAHLPSSHLRL